MYYVDENVKNTIRINGGDSRYGYYRYDMNENPEGLPQEFIDKVLEEITPEFLSVYPETTPFIKKYANFVQMKETQICVTNGSDMAIRYILEVFAEKGKDVVTVTPSFEMYGVNCNLLGLHQKAINYNEDLSINIEDIINAINRNTNIVVLINPNNPIGNTYSQEEVIRIIRKAQKYNALVIIDEAYYYFYDYTFINLVNEYDNVIVLRTFSKLFSLAACRLGVIISNPNIINYINNIRLSFDTNAIALKFGEKILEEPELISQLIQSEKDGKHFILTDLNKHGYETRDCSGNFIFIKTKIPPSELAIILKEKYKVLVKTYNINLLKSYIRVSIGSKESMKLFLSKFYEADL